MTIKILKGSDPVTITSLVVMIYGQPGTGKTSTAFTSSNPLLLDFDNGAHRSAFRKDAVRISQWSDVTSMDQSDLSGYDTLIVDTVGRCLDSLAASIIKSKPRFGYGGSLSLQGYGALKSGFAQWLNLMRSFGLDIVLLAHDKEDKRGDDLVVRPDMTGGSYGEVFKCCDAVGVQYMDGGKRVLNFQPTDVYVAKNPAAFDPLTIPDFLDTPDYMATLIADIKGRIGQVSEQSRLTAAEITDLRATIDAIDNAEAANKMLATLSDKPKGPVRAQSKRALMVRTEAIGLVFNTTSMAFAAKS